VLWFDKDRVPEGRWPFLRTVYAGFRNIEEVLVEQLDLTEGTSHLLITGCLQAYRQAVVRRALDLAQAAIVSWNAGQLVGAIVCSRALLETIATYHSFLTRAEAAAAVGDWELIGRLVDAYAFSTMSSPNKRKRTPEHPPRIGEIVIDFIKATSPGCERFWEQICDAAHPNGERMLTIAGDLRDLRYEARSAADNESQLFGAVFNCLNASTWLIASDLDFDILLERIRTGGDLPPDHPLITNRDLIDNVVREVAGKLPPMRPGPAKRPGRRPR
jgi:hypothetical protein